MGFFFRVIRWHLHLVLLKISPDSVDQVSRLQRSLCKEAASAIESMRLNIFVSSAKDAIFECLIPSGRSLTYNRKSIGPNMDPVVRLKSLASL